MVTAKSRARGTTRLTRYRRGPWVKGATSEEPSQREKEEPAAWLRRRCGPARGGVAEAVDAVGYVLEAVADGARAGAGAGGTAARGRRRSRPVGADGEREAGELRGCGGRRRDSNFLGPHFVRACPQRQSLNAVQTKEPESGEEEEAAETGSISIGALRLLNALKAQWKDNKGNGGYSATHNFIATGEAKRLGLTLSKDGSRMKAVNSKAQPIAGLAKEVPVSIGSWTGKANFMSVPLDDFQVILGMEFLQTARGVPMPFLDALCMMGDESPYVVPVVRKTTDARQISALQLKKGVKMGELTYVAALKLETGSGDETPTPPLVAKLLKEFKDVMPPELPKSLPPRRAVDHRIELEPGTRASARSPYRMSPPELAELRKQLDELLKAVLFAARKHRSEPLYFSRRSMMAVCGYAWIIGL
uniref:Uncharacterized protein n=1 Tax=Ananas comosus var. bracteatus TaxID=296719 RepID=A0A6V7NX02_ANACO|nr:unnamed protein product [Ananas comosus var. bracteatus]